MLILKPHLMFTLQLSVFHPGMARNCSLLVDFTQPKTPSTDADQQYAGQNDRMQEPKKPAFLA
jgi:hypothetical protein